VHEKKTAEDIQAEQMVRALISEISPGADFELTSTGLKGVDAPWVFSGGSLFQGLERIKVFARLARETAR